MASIVLLDDIMNECLGVFFGPDSPEALNYTIPLDYRPTDLMSAVYCIVVISRTFGPCKDVRNSTPMDAGRMKMRVSWWPVGQMRTTIMPLCGVSDFGFIILRDHFWFRY